MKQPYRPSQPTRASRECRRRLREETWLRKPPQFLLSHAPVQPYLIQWAPGGALVGAQRGPLLIYLPYYGGICHLCGRELRTYTALLTSGLNQQEGPELYPRPPGGSICLLWGSKPSCAPSAPGPGQRRDAALKELALFRVSFALPQIDPWYWAIPMCLHQLPPCIATSYMPHMPELA